MRVVLISPYGTVAAMGLRSLSACLASAGHHVSMIFLPHSRREASIYVLHPEELYTSDILEQVAVLCQGAGLIGISLMTNQFFRAQQLTKYLRARLDIPIVLGGVHPTLRPQECLEFADIICIGEGEGAIVDLARRLSQRDTYHDVANLWCRLPNGEIGCTPSRPLIRDLDSLPLPDRGPSNHYVLDQSRIRPLTEELFRRYMHGIGLDKDGLTYPLMTSRGCPHRCAYCTNSAFVELYPEWQHVRRRTISSVIEEIQSFRRQYPSTTSVAFFDDEFLAVPQERLREFAEQYKEEVGLPFYCMAGPTTINRERLETVKSAGMIKMAMGIESGSRRGQTVFERPANSHAILKAAKLLHEYSARPPFFDLITDNPYEGIPEQLETLRLLRQIPTPFELCLFSLVFYPGTALGERARAEGLISDEKKEVYVHHYWEVQPTLYNLVLHVIRKRAYDGRPLGWLVALLCRPSLYRLLSANWLRAFWRTAYPTMVAKLGLHR
jgi:anaerobic magnesium-protoporphyrin IX monomethyl ester cyclase